MFTYKTVIASLFSIALLSSPSFAVEPNLIGPDKDKPVNTPAENSIEQDAGFLEKVKLVLATAAFGLAFSFRHKFGEDPIAGNDRIIFATFYANDKAYDEGVNLGGTIMTAVAQCEAAKELYERHYNVGICEQIKVYAPNAHKFEVMVWDATLKFVIVPTAVVGTLFAAATTFCIHKKLKQE